MATRSTFKWYLLPHGMMGACALLLGPMQFSDRLRRRFTKFHRVVGRFYVAGVFAAAPLGFYIQHFEERLGGTRSFCFAGSGGAGKKRRKLPATGQVRLNY